MGAPHPWSRAQKVAIVASYLRRGQTAEETAALTGLSLAFVEGIREYVLAKRPLTCEGRMRGR